MNKILTILIFFSTTLTCCSQIYDFSVCQQYNEANILNSNEYTLIVITSAGCGYCDLALRQLNHYQGLKNINVIIYDKGRPEDTKRLYGKYFDKYLFVNGNTCDLFSDDYFPTYYLFKGRKKIWKRKGYYENTLDKVVKIVQ